MFSHFVSAIAAEISPNLIEKVPPKPQQTSLSFISLSATPGIFASRLRGCCLTPSSRSPAQES